MRIEHNKNNESVAFYELKIGTPFYIANVSNDCKILFMKTDKFEHNPYDIVNAVNIENGSLVNIDRFQEVEIAKVHVEDNKEQIMNIFISQPMRGKTTEQIEQEREDVVEALKNTFGENIKILDTVFYFTEDVPALVYLGRSIEVLSKADLAVFMYGWQDARGCRIEHQCAVDYDICTLEFNRNYCLC